MTSASSARRSCFCPADFRLESLTRTSTLSTVARTCSVGLSALEGTGSNRQESKTIRHTPATRASVIFVALFRTRSLIVPPMIFYLALLDGVYLTPPLVSYWDGSNASVSCGYAPAQVQA